MVVQTLFSMIFSLVVIAWILSRLGKLFAPTKNTQDKKRPSALKIIFWLLLERMFPFLFVFSAFSGLKSAFKKGWDEKGEEREAGTAHSGMSKDEAWQVLGVDPNASKQDIKDAYKRLMMRNHPDGGGTDALAARINQARDTLLKR